MVRIPRHGGRVGAALWLLATLSWASSVIAAPLLADRHLSRSATIGVATAYLLGRAICHQQAARSFHLRGVQLPVCARCTGLYLAAPAGAAVAWWGRRRRRPEAAVTRDRRLRLTLGASALPALVTAAVEAAGLIDFSGLARAACALPLGASVAWALGATLRGDLR